MNAKKLSRRESDRLSQRKSRELSGLGNQFGWSWGVLESQGEARGIELAELRDDVIADRATIAGEEMGEELMFDRQSEGRLISMMVIS
jgi:hypothetical protein